jgi:hypothetical protein
MLPTPNTLTNAVLTEQARDLSGTGVLSTSLHQEPDARSFLALPPNQTRHQINAAESMIEAIGTLGEGWDGYDAIAISPVVCSNAKTFLRIGPSELSVPEITPTSNGTLNFEWASNNAEAYLEIGQTRFTGHIQTKKGETIYLDGTLGAQPKPDYGIRQALALISGLLHASSSTPSLSQTFQVPK